MALRVGFLLALLGAPVVLAAQTPRTTIVMLGTGTPIPDPDRSGPAVAIIVDSVAYLFDAGVGVVRRASEAGQRGVAAFAPSSPGAQPAPRFDRVFLTHLHSDHTLGLADVILTPWVQGRKAPLDVYGPAGTEGLVDGILDGNAIDIAERVASAGGPGSEGWKVRVHEVRAGLVYRDARIAVHAFAVPHGGLEDAFAYRIATPDRVIVISGDTRASADIAAQCNGCDVLIHEAYSDAGFATVPAVRQAYHRLAHTSATELGRIAAAARPRLLVLYHQLFFGASDETLLAEVRSQYNGKVVSARDLDVH
jgi:ribonuclease Z